jgi:hypothetical protein
MDGLGASFEDNILTLYNLCVLLCMTPWHRPFIASTAIQPPAEPTLPKALWQILKLGGFLDALVAVLLAFLLLPQLCSS